MAEDQEQWSDEQVIEHMRATKAAIEEGLANLGVADDDVSGFQFSASFQLAAPLARPELVSRLGPRFNANIPSNVADTNGHCGFIC